MPIYMSSCSTGNAIEPQSISGQASIRQTKKRENKTSISTYQKGKEGEDLAAVFLEENGINVIGRNYRSTLGEIDIIALDGDVLVFVEVKSWIAYTSENLEYGLNKKKQRKIVETAKFFIKENRKYREVAVRFDVVFVSAGGITHITSAFTESLWQRSWN